MRALEPERKRQEPCPGSNSGISTTHEPYINFGSNDFTIQAWFRLTIGVARYTGAFTVPSAEFDDW